MLRIEIADLVRTQTKNSARGVLVSERTLTEQRVWDCFDCARLARIAPAFVVQEIKQPILFHGSAQGCAEYVPNQFLPGDTGRVVEEAVRGRQRVAVIF